jgi:hypothetical protein
MEYNNHKEHIDDVIATSVGVDPMAMYYVQQRMNFFIGGSFDNLTEKDPMMAACVDEIIEGIDQSIAKSFKNIDVTSPRFETAKSKVQQDFIWFESPLDKWFDSYPELEKALDLLPEAVESKAKDDYVWFAAPLDKSIVSQLDARLANKSINKSGVKNDQDDYVWFEMMLDKWIESQPGVKAALDELSKMNKSDETINDHAETLANNKVA